MLDAIEQRRATIFIGVPAMYRMLLEAGAEDARPDVRAGLGLGRRRDAGRAGRAVQAAWARRATLPVVGPVGEALFVEGYGMVEIGGGVALKVAAVPARLGESLGSAARLPVQVVDDDGREVALGQVGELWVQGPGVLKRLPGRRDGDRRRAHRRRLAAHRRPRPARAVGTVAFAGRKKDVIKHGGYSVYAVEVEEALEEHPDVLEAAVVGLPDERKGEVPVAAVRLREGRRSKPAELVAWAAERLADYKVPVRSSSSTSCPAPAPRRCRRAGCRALRRSRLRRRFTPPSSW